MDARTRRADTTPSWTQLHAAPLEVSDGADDDGAPREVLCADIRLVRHPRDLAHPSRIRRTIGQRRQAKEKADLTTVGGRDEGLVDAKEEKGREGVAMAQASLWQPESPAEGVVRGVKRKMDATENTTTEEEFDELIEPKVESPGEEAALALIESHRRSMEVLSPAKRPRGRPRKHPVVLESTSKVTKGRSKTGCITCRKRKKKCDEMKPRCKLSPDLDSSGSACRPGYFHNSLSLTNDDEQA